LNIANKKFDTEKEIEQKFIKTAPISASLLEEMENAVIDKKSTIQFKPIDATTYATITFSSLIFIVIGLYLANISKLKVGTIELEKTTTDTISNSVSLGISR